MKFWGKISASGFIFLALASISLSTVWAHASYVRSDPPASTFLASGKAPGQVQVWFSEGLEPKFSELQVVNDQRQRVDNGDSHLAPNDPQSMIITLKPNLSDGAYTVIYKTTSAEDGHVLKNSFAFVVGAGALPTSAVTSSEAAVSDEEDDNFNFWSVALRWLNYLGAAALIGGAAWRLFIWQPAMRQVSSRIGPEQVAASRVAEQRGRWLILIAMAGLAVGWIGWLLYQGTRFSGVALWELFGNSTFGNLLFGSRFGLVWLIRLGVLVLAGLVLYFMSGKASFPGVKLPRAGRFNLVPDTDQPPPVESKMMAETTTQAVNLSKPRNLGYWLLLECGAALMLTTLFSAHATLNPVWLLVPAHWLHLMATGFWVGGLFYLALALPPVLAALRPGTGDRTRLLAALIPNFSVIAIISVSILIVTGTLQAAIHLGSFSDFFDTPYGITLFIKLMVAALVLLLGAYHHFKVSPAMKAFARRKSENNGAGSMAAGKLQYNFKRTILVEAALAAILLGIVGGLTSFGPPANALKTSGILQRGQFADLNYILQVDPAEIGTNNFNVTLTQSDGQPLVKTDAVVLRLSMLDMDMGQQEIELKPVASLPGHYQTQGQILSMSGHWRADLIVRRPGKEDAQVPVEFQVK